MHRAMSTKPMSSSSAAVRRASLLPSASSNAIRTCASRSSRRAPRLVCTPAHSPLTHTPECIAHRVWHVRTHPHTQERTFSRAPSSSHARSMSCCHLGRRMGYRSIALARSLTHLLTCSLRSLTGSAQHVGHARPVPLPDREELDRHARRTHYIIVTIDDSGTSSIALLVTTARWCIRFLNSTIMATTSCRSATCAAGSARRPRTSTASRSTPASPPPRCCTTSAVTSRASPPVTSASTAKAGPRARSLAAWSCTRASRSSPRAAAARSPRASSTSSSCETQTTSRPTASASRRCALFLPSRSLRHVAAY